MFRGKKVLVTGHTGFKGTWLAHWLLQLGAEVVGYSLPPPTEPSLFDFTKLGKKMRSVVGDVRDRGKLERVFREERPEVVFHLAAQPLVIDSYHNPYETMEVNAIGTVAVLEAIRKNPSVQCALMVTTDKCYENKEWSWGYREEDPLGGRDPYSASKAMAELSIASYRRSFFSERNATAIASVRAGNVIGGGDFASYRIFPDIVRALMEKKPIAVRNPSSVRPWLSVHDALSGYILLAERLLKDRKYAKAWNFGPLERDPVSVRALVEKAVELWGEGEIREEGKGPKEMNYLKLSWDQAATELGWEPKMSWKETVKSAVEWYQAFQRGEDITAFQLENYAISFAAH